MEAKNMPVVVQLRKQEDYASANSYFSESSSLAQNLKIVRRGNEQFYQLYSPRNTQIGVDNENQKYVTKDITVLESVSSESDNFSESAVFNSEFSNFITQNLVVTDEELDDSFFYGIQVIEHQPKVIFSHQVELRLNELEKWRPQITIDSFLLDDDE
jgi:hypothetical protein